MEVRRYLHTVTPLAKSRQRRHDPMEGIDPIRKTPKTWTKMYGLWSLCAEVFAFLLAQVLLDWVTFQARDMRHC